MAGALDPFIEAKLRGQAVNSLWRHMGKATLQPVQVLQQPLALDTFTAGKVIDHTVNWSA